MNKFQTKRRSAMTMAPVMMAIAIGLMLSGLPSVVGPAQEATPSSNGCAGVLATPSTSMADHDAMQAATPGMHDMGSMEEEVAFDLAYIDMMIPHHQSIIALAQVALPELSDPRLVEIAQAVIETQSAEQDHLQMLRDEWYPDAPPVSMDAMTEVMPSMASMPMDSMMPLMSPGWLVSTFCSAENPDLAFIQLTIPHHQMAIDASDDAVEEAEHEELVEIAKGVIEGQQAEIDELNQIHAELTGEATPAA